MTNRFPGSISRLCQLALAVTAFVALGGAGGGAQPTLPYSAGFESSEGFRLDLPLVQQPGWTGIGSDGMLQTDGNGIVGDYFGGQGQQAYVGFHRLTGTNDTLNVWHPLNLDPIAAGKPVVKFTVSMAIFDSTNEVYDCFRWSVYNNQNGGRRLFAIDFENSSLGINYILDDDVIVPTDFRFESADLTQNRGIYDLEVTMNFASNRWSALLSGESPVLIVNSKPITTKGAALTLGDVDAVWVYGPYTNAPGNNFMVFDNYTVTAEAAAPLPFQLEGLGFGSGGSYLLRLTGESGRQYVVEASTNLTQWTSIRTNTATGGSFDLIDTTPSSPMKFYRARTIQ